jgi:hypothetical protein
MSPLWEIYKKGENENSPTKRTLNKKETVNKVLECIQDFDECTCACHREPFGTIQHCAPCCYGKCPSCGLNVTFAAWTTHLNRCPKNTIEPILVPLTFYRPAKPIKGLPTYESFLKAVNKDESSSREAR